MYYVCSRVLGSRATGFNRFVDKYGNLGSDALIADGDGDDIVESTTYELGINQGWAAGGTTGWIDVALYTTEQDGVQRREAGAIESVKVDQSGQAVEMFALMTGSLRSAARRVGKRGSVRVVYGGRRFVPKKK